MTSKLLEILALFALLFGTFSVGVALADDENEVKFMGLIESLPSTAGFIGDWRISGRTVHVTSATRIELEDGQIALGATVKVEGAARADNSIDAEEIEVKHAGADDDEQPEFKGTIEILPGTAGFIGDWRVGGRTIHVSASTKIETEDGPVAVGAFVEVKGALRTDGSMDATKIEVKSNVAGGDGRDELKGTIESLPNSPAFIGDWRVAGRVVHVSTSTIIDREHGPVAVGAFVEVKGTMRPDGSIDAAKIEVKSSSDDSGSGNEGQRVGVKGTIQSLPSTPGLVGDWIVAGRLIHVVSSTRLNAEHGAFFIGARVKVKGVQMADGSVVATKVQSRDSN
jgi:hypothetical protein